MHRFFLPGWTAAFLLVLVGTLGCASTSPSADQRDEQAQFLGTWQYRTVRAPGLDEGTFRIAREGDRLIAIVRDARRGRLRARVHIWEDRMALRLNGIRVAGRLEDGRYEATVEVSTWDVRRAPSRSPSARRDERLRGSLVARRTDAPPSTSGPGYGCRPLLRETSYACSPLSP